MADFKKNLKNLKITLDQGVIKGEWPFQEQLPDTESQMDPRLQINTDLDFKKLGWGRIPEIATGGWIHRHTLNPVKYHYRTAKLEGGITE